MFERRLQILLSVLAVVCGVLVVRAFSLQAIGRSHWTDVAKLAQLDEQQIPTVRGRILDVKGRELAIDQPCIDACVHYQAICPTPDRVWLNNVARVRVKKKIDDYADRPLAERKTLLAAEVGRVKADIDTMWHDLAVLSGQTEEQIDELRADIVRRVKTRQQIVWYSKFNNATTQPAAKSWLARMFGQTQGDLDSFDLHVGEENDVHIILPHIDYNLRNELARRAGRYPGLVLREGVMRVYPYGSAACQTIGHVGRVLEKDTAKDPEKDNPLRKYDPTDDIGREGLEAMLERRLRGTRGQTNNDADAETPASPDANAAATPAEPDIAPVPGEDVTTTIDIELQKRVEEAFKTVDFSISGHRPMDTLNMPGAAVVIDLATGEVRALASWPTYDLNKFDELYPSLQRQWIDEPLRNRALALQTVPGSTVKPMVGISAISSGVFGAHDTIHCDGFLYINGKKQTSFGRCWTMNMFGNTHMQTPSYATHPDNNLTFPQALQRSCNVFHETLACRMGLPLLCEWFRKFGLGKPTGVGLPEFSGLLPDEVELPRSEALSSLSLAGIGESHVEATPIQMANVAATIARNGFSIKPTLIHGEQNAPVDLHLDPEAVREAHQGMYDVVNTAGGTGHPAFVPDGNPSFHGDGTLAEVPEVYVAAKTGSAQTAPLRIKERDELMQPIKNDKGRFIWDTIILGTHDHPNPAVPWYRAIGEREEKIPAHGWMIGFAPADHPTIAFCVLIQYGGGGGPAAGSVVRKLLEACTDLGYVAGNS